jgi:hypothetical protein
VSEPTEAVGGDLGQLLVPGAERIDEHLARGPADRDERACGVVATRGVSAVQHAFQRSDQSRVLQLAGQLDGGARGQAVRRLELVGDRADGAIAERDHHRRELCQPLGIARQAQPLEHRGHSGLAELEQHLRGAHLGAGGGTARLGGAVRHTRTADRELQHRPVAQLAQRGLGVGACFVVERRRAARVRGEDEHGAVDLVGQTEREQCVGRRKRIAAGLHVGVAAGAIELAQLRLERLAARITQRTDRILVDARRAGRDGLRWRCALDGPVLLAGCRGFDLERLGVLGRVRFEGGCGRGIEQHVGRRVARLHGCGCDDRLGWAGEL